MHRSLALVIAIATASGVAHARAPDCDSPRAPIALPVVDTSPASTRAIQSRWVELGIGRQRTQFTFDATPAEVIDAFFYKPVLEEPALVRGFSGDDRLAMTTLATNAGGNLLERLAARTSTVHRLSVVDGFGFSGVSRDFAGRLTLTTPTFGGIETPPPPDFEPPAVRTMRGKLVSPLWTITWDATIRPTETGSSLTETLKVVPNVGDDTTLAERGRMFDGLNQILKTPIGGLVLADAVQALIDRKLLSAADLAALESADDPYTSDVLAQIRSRAIADPLVFKTLVTEFALALRDYMALYDETIPQRIADMNKTPPVDSAPSSDRFRDDVFDSPVGWEPHFDDDTYSQRIQLRGGEVFCETEARAVNARREEIVAALRGPWSWWHKGRYEDRVEHGDGSITYVLRPTGKLVPLAVNERMHPPEPRRGRPDITRIPIDLEAGANGFAYFEVEAVDDSTSIVRGRFAGVTPEGMVGWLLGARRFGETHLDAERGGLSFPFRGTGLVGLIELVED